MSDSPTNLFTIVEPRDQEIGGCYVNQKRRATDFKAPKLWKGSSRGRPVPDPTFHSFRARKSADQCFWTTQNQSTCRFWGSKVVECSFCLAAISVLHHLLHQRSHGHTSFLSFTRFLLCPTDLMKIIKISSFKSKRNKHDDDFIWGRNKRIRFGSAKDSVGQLKLQRHLTFQPPSPLFSLTIMTDCAHISSLPKKWRKKSSLPGGCMFKIPNLFPKLFLVALYLRCNHYFWIYFALYGN